MTGIFGRDVELSRLRDFVLTSRREGPPVLALLGEAGTGKSTLLDAAAQEAAAHGRRVLRCTG
ncbi:ATP-binding protein, partial [Streptomyces sp. TRM76130]|nr:ATP-binding protein [Streptomyces sp. TRM76130]